MAQRSATWGGGLVARTWSEDSGPSIARAGNTPYSNRPSVSQLLQEEGDDLHSTQNLVFPSSLADLTPSPRVSRSLSSVDDDTAPSPRSSNSSRVQLSSVLSATAWTFQSKGKWRGQVIGQPRLAVQGLILALLILTDALALVSKDSDDTWPAGLGATLAGLYGFLVIILALRSALQARGGCAIEASYDRPVAWFIPALLHIAAAFTSAWWREQQSCRATGTRAASVAGAMQCLLAVLYGADARYTAALAFSSAVVLTLLEAMHGIDAMCIVDDIVVLAACGVCCAVAAASRIAVEAEMSKIFSPILEVRRSKTAQVSTNADQLIERLRDARDRAKRSGLESALREVLCETLEHILGKLTDGGLHRMSLEGDPNTRHLNFGAVVENRYLDLWHDTLETEQPSPTHIRRSAPPAIGRKEAWSQSGPRDLLSPHSGALRGLGSSGDWLLPSQAAPAQEQEDEETTSKSFEQCAEEMVAALCYSDGKEGLPPPRLEDGTLKALSKDLGVWRFHIFKFCQVTDWRPLSAMGGLALDSTLSRLSISRSRAQQFLTNLESRYVSDNPYHNSIHAADVLNNMLFFLRLHSTPFAHVEPVERFAALIAASAHDVGHMGFTNSFHKKAETPLSCLYSDQSPLEGMHCAITLNLLRLPQCDLLEGLFASMRSTFRFIVTNMILDTDLAKHVQNLSNFRKEFLCSAREEDAVLSSAQRKDLLSFALKCCDVAHSSKPFEMHVDWTLRINAEFFAQGDVERAQGLPFSPLCDREGTRVAESQRGFFDFVAAPLFGAMGEYLDEHNFKVEVLARMSKNRNFWKLYDGAEFDYTDLPANADMLRQRFLDFFLTDGVTKSKLLEKTPTSEKTPERKFHATKTLPAQVHPPDHQVIVLTRAPKPLKAVSQLW